MSLSWPDCPLPVEMRWRRLDVPGEDHCRLERSGEGWRLSGEATFTESAPACLRYRLDCDADWVSVTGEVRGTIGQRSVAYEIVRGSEGWSLNGVASPRLGRLLDLDLGFTPATNLTQIRRARAFAPGLRVHVPVAWLDVDAGTLSELPQVYTLRTPTAYWYESPTAGYQGLLRVDQHGFIRSYPGLWAENSQR